MMILKLFHDKISRQHEFKYKTAEITPNLKLNEMEIQIRIKPKYMRYLKKGSCL